MAPKTNCTPAKLAAALAYLQKSRVAHTIKDLEKSLPSVAQINGMQVKDYIQTLQDDSKIRAERIGSVNWYWNFVLDDKITRQRALDAAKATYGKAVETDEELKRKLKDAESQRRADDEALEDGGECRRELLSKKRLLEIERENVRHELAAYSDNDPAELEHKSKEADELRRLTEEYTDDIYSMEGWLKDALTGNAEALSATLEAVYDKEYDEEARTLKELAL